MKLKQLLKTKQTTTPLHQCKGIQIAISEKEVLGLALDGLRDVLKERLKDYESRETTFQGLSRMEKDYNFIQSQVRIIGSLMGKL